MNILKNSQLYYSDIKRIIDNFSEIKLFNNKSIFITGCNGLICSTIVDLLITANSIYNLNLSIYLASRDIKKSKDRFGDENECLKFIEYDASKIFLFDKQIDFSVRSVLHYRLSFSN